MTAILWFDDGNIVLATDVHLYRVHKGVLTKNSSFFKDMLAFPTGGNGYGGGGVASDLCDGLPLVRMVGYVDENVYHLLMSLYDREHYRAYKPTTLPIILSLLGMSTKYDFAAIRREVIHQLEFHYPSDLDKWFREEGNSLLSAMDDIPDGYEFQLLAAARRHNVLTILPALSYNCASESLDSIFKYMGELDAEDIRRIVSGREKLTKYSYEFGATALFPEVKCRSSACTEARAKLLIDWMHFDDLNPPDFPLDASLEGLDAIGNVEDRVDICPPCRGVSRLNLNVFRRNVWVDLPTIFELGSWEGIKSSQI